MTSRFGPAALSVVLLLVAACATPHRPIPAGTYYPDSGAERIVVVPSRIWFHVNVDPQSPEVIGSREYPYEVTADGHIVFIVSSNSTFGLRLSMDYDWLWQDGVIVRVRLQDGERTRFVLRR